MSSKRPLVPVCDSRFMRVFPKAKKRNRRKGRFDRRIGRSATVNIDRATAVGKLSAQHRAALPLPIRH